MKQVKLSIDTNDELEALVSYRKVERDFANNKQAIVCDLVHKEYKRMERKQSKELAEILKK